MNRESAIAAFAAVVGDNHVTARQAALAAAGVAASAGILVRPGAPGEVAELVAIAAARGIAVVPVGANTRVSSPRSNRPALFLDLGRLTHIVHLDETSLIVHVQAGLTAFALEKILAPRGLSLGDFPPSSLNSSIGGLLAVRTPGKSSRRHGFIEDAVLGVSAVLADGRTIHTRIAPRRATGPDLARAVCGSEGTLGIITSAVLRIHRQPEARFLAAFVVPSFGEALAAVRLALREEAAPAAMRAYDGAAARAHLGDEACADGEAVLLAATAGSTDLAACDRELVASAVTALGGRRIDDRYAETWWARRTGAAEETMPLPHLQVSATLGKQLDVYRRVCAAARDAGFDVRAHASRFDLDGGVLFFTLTTADGEASVGEDEIRRTQPALEGAAAEAGAYLLGSWNQSLAPYFDTLRAGLDAARALNPDVG